MENFEDMLEARHGDTVNKIVKAIKAGNIQRQDDVPMCWQGAIKYALAKGVVVEIDHVLGVVS